MAAWIQAHPPAVCGALAVYVIAGWLFRLFKRLRRRRPSKGKPDDDV